MSYTQEELEAMGAINPNDNNKEERERIAKILQERIDELVREINKYKTGKQQP